jgi:hypothetical protein
MSQSADYRWLVEQRGRIQGTLLDLHECSSSPLVNASSSDPHWPWVWAFLGGAAFSLWRAVFLAEIAESEPDDWPAIHSNATAFLGEVIRTNSITFTQDHNMRVWTSRYYLHNAYCKIAAAIDRLHNVQGLETELTRPEIRRALEQTFPRTTRRDLWVTAYTALAALVAILRDRATSAAHPPT